MSLRSSALAHLLSLSKGWRSSGCKSKLQEGGSISHTYSGTCWRPQYTSNEQVHSSSETWLVYSKWTNVTCTAQLVYSSHNLSSSSLCQTQPESGRRHSTVPVQSVPQWHSTFCNKTTPCILTSCQHTWLSTGSQKKTTPLCSWRAQIPNSGCYEHVSLAFEGIFSPSHQGYLLDYALRYYVQKPL